MRFARIGSLTVFIILVVFLPSGLSAASSENCLACHGEKGIGQGGRGSLFLDSKLYNNSSHAALGCDACHPAISPRHPEGGKKSKRVECGECHGDAVKEYAGTKHSQYAQCVDCHSPHETKALRYSSVPEANAGCLKCHDSEAMLKGHRVWLPNTAIHLASLPCVACHTSSEKLVVMLHPLKGKRGKEIRATAADISGLDLDGDQKVSLQELRRFQKTAGGKNLRFEGIMMPEVMTHSYQVLDNRRNCTFCHAAGPKIIETSRMLMPDDEGTLKQVLPVEKGAILDLLYGTPDFYVMGASRSTLMNMAGIMMVSLGFAVPLVHGTARMITRRTRRKGKTEAATHEPLYLTPAPVRIWHWLNALGMVALIISGIQLRFADRIELFGSFKAAINLHDTVGVVVAGSYLIWLGYYVVSRSLFAIYLPEANEIKTKLIPQLRFYLSEYFQGKPNPHTSTPANKFNPLQKIVYFIIMFFSLPLVILSGLSLMFVDVLREYLSIIGGLRVITAIHYLLGCIFVAFLIVHIYLSTLGRTKTAYLKQMWTGWES